VSSDFKKFWIGQTISNLGSSFTQWAVPLLVYQLTHSAVNLGIATAATFLPYLLFGLVIGAWMDRVDRKRAMIALDSLNALVILSIPLVAQFGHLNVWWIYGVTFIQSTIFHRVQLGRVRCDPEPRLDRRPGDGERADPGDVLGGAGRGAAARRRAHLTLPADVGDGLRFGFVRDLIFVAAARPRELQHAERHAQGGHDDSA